MLAALVGAVGLAVGGGAGAAIGASTVEPEVETITETVEVDRNVAPRACREAMESGHSVIDIQAERFEMLYMNSPNLDDVRSDMRRSVILLESARDDWDEQSKLCLYNRTE